MKHFRLLTLLAALPLSACFARAAAPIVRHYRLSYEPPRVEARRLPIVLRIAPLRIDSIYASEAIVYREDEFRVESYHRHRWSADPARINHVMVLLILTVLVIYVTMVYGPIAAFLVEFFPTRVRYTSLSLPYHLGNGEFGGWLPFIATAMVTSAAAGGMFVGLASITTSCS